MNDTASSLESQYSRLREKAKIRSHIVEALLAGRPISTASIVHTSGRTMMPVYISGIRHFVWTRLDRGLVAKAESGDDSARLAVIRQFNTLVALERSRFAALLLERRPVAFGLSGLTLAQVEHAYNTVQKEIVAEIDVQNKRTKLLPDALVKAMQEGTVQVVEDVQEYLVRHEEAYFEEVFDTSATALASMSDDSKRTMRQRSIDFFKNHFVNAQKRFLALLPHINPTDLSLTVLESKLTSRKRDVIQFLTEILAIVTEVQQNADAIEEVDTLGYMTDLDDKTLWDLVQIVFYKLSYGVGIQRKFWAQLILTLTEAAHTIHEHPQKARATEAIRDINMDLNLDALDAEVGREGRNVDGIYRDKAGNYFTEAGADRKPIKNWKMLKLKPRANVPVYSEDGEQVIAHKDIPAMWVLIMSRAKDLKSILRKCLDYGITSLDRLNDLAGFKTIILPDQFIEEWKKMNVGEPTSDWLEKRMAQAAIDLENYFRDVVGANSLVEKPQHQLGTAISGSKSNGATAATFKENKFVFYKMVDGTPVRVEWQIIDLAGYLRIISHDTPEAHGQYRKRRVAQKQTARVLFPAEVWPGFVAELQDSLSGTKE